MTQSAGRIVLDCFRDLGVTIVYAVAAGLLIVAVVASDDGPASFLASAFYASLLPLFVVGLILLDAVMRLGGERFAARKRRSAPPLHAHRA